MKRLLKLLQNIKDTAIEGVQITGGPNPWETSLVISVHPTKGQQLRCPKCGKKMPYYDEGEGPRFWRALDLGVIKVWLHGRAPRVRCLKHNVIVASVPWARHGSWFTRPFEEWVCWMSVHCTRSVVSECCRIDWKSVGPIISRVQADLEAARGRSRFDGLVRLGVDETSYRKGYKYMTVVVNHDTSEVIWAHKGHGKGVLEKFFKSLTPEQRASIKAVTGDGAKWITECVEESCPSAQRLLDPFHIVQWATDALDDVRKRIWNELRKGQKKEKRRRGRPKKGEKPAADKASEVKGSRYALLKNPEDLTQCQQAKLEMLAVENTELHRAYTYKERLRLLLKLGPEEAASELGLWLSGACRSRIPEIVELSKKIRRHKVRIIDTVASGLSNARVEAFNNKIKVTIKMGYGFRNIDNLIALVYLRCSNLPVALPGRRPRLKAA
jgi:transposase